MTIHNGDNIGRDSIGTQINVKGDYIEKLQKLGKLNSAKVDGNGNIILQDVNNSTVNIGLTNLDALIQVLQNLGKLTKEIHEKIIDLKKTNLISDAPALQYKDVIYDKTSYKNIFKLLQSSSLILYGTGGSGKTTFAKVLVGEGRKKKYFQKTYWVTATRGFSKQQSEELIQSLQSYKGKNLLVIDDFQPKDKLNLENLYEKLLTWKIVVTTRGNFNIKGFISSPYKTNEDRAKRIFWTYYFNEKQSDLWFWYQDKLNTMPIWVQKNLNTLCISHKELLDFCKEIAYHSLTLELVAKLLKNDNSLNLATIRKKIKEKKLDDKQIATLIETGYLKDKTESGEMSAYKCLLIAFENAKALNETERILLQNLCILPALNWKKEEWLFIWNNEVQWINAENKLIEYGWLQKTTIELKWWEFFKTPSPATYQIHSLVREMLFYEFSNPQTWCYANCQQLLTFLYNKSKENPNSKAESYLAESITNLLKLITENNEEWADFLLWEIGKFYATSKPTTTGAATALRANEKAEKIYQALGNRHSRAICYSKLGNIYTEIGDLDKALACYTTYHQLVYELYKKNVDYKQSLAISYSKLGKTQAALGNFEKALEFFEQSNELEKELYEAHPANVEFKSNLAISYSDLGETQAELGNFEKALEFFEQSKQLKKELYKAYPVNIAYKNGLATSYGGLGLAHFKSDNFEKALEFFEKYNQLEKELHKADPANVIFKMNLAISFQYLGVIKYELGDLGELECFEIETKLYKELYEDYPTNVNIKNRLAVSYFHLGDFYINPDKQKAKNYYLESQKLLAELVQTAPDYVEFQKHLKELENRLAGL